MGNILYCEWLKLKRSKIVMIGFGGGSLAVPLLVVLLSIRMRFVYPDMYDDLASLYDNEIVFLMLLFAPLMLAITATYLISREYTEGTLKTIFSVPVTRGRFLAGKFLMLFMLVMVFMFLAWIEMFVLALLYNLFIGLEQVSVMSAVYFLPRMLKGGILLYATTLPFFYLAMRTRGFVASFSAIAVVSLLNVVLSGASKVAGFYPWTAAYWIVCGKIEQTGVSPLTGYLVIALVGILSLGASMIRFFREDIR